MLTSGQLLADRYRLGTRIAVGGMGEVWEAADTRLDRKVAVKVLKPELCGNAEFLHRFRTEARTTASLNHPNIAAIHDYGETAAVPDGPEDTAYLVMELVEGDPLAAILATQGRLNADRALDMLEQAGQALQAAHERGYVHRDVKPGNIMVTPNGKVKLTDFGIAKAADAAPVTRSGMVMGTAHYIAPEQALGGEAEPASDVYSLAVVGYECLMGHRPFVSDNAVTVAMMHIRENVPPLPPDVPIGARTLIENTLVKDPRRRYRTGGEFAAAVSAVRAGHPLPAPSGLAMLSNGPITGNIPRVPPGGNMMMPAAPVQNMPPAPPAHGPAPMGHHPGGGYHPGMQQPPRRRSNAAAWTVVSLLVVILIGLAVWGISTVLQEGQGRAESPGSGTDLEEDSGPSVSDEDVLPSFPEPDEQPPPGQSENSALVELAETEFQNKPSEVVAERLEELGMRPTVVGIDDDPVELARMCLVTGIEPSGLQPVNTEIVVRCTTGGA
ncbi:protein kinase domain-containing protein [Actinoalloteichus hymeniacidonis]|uniref:non-specific serine/threonine protein kinase n=1 Tax=Actinoalloteichus hymeniacidonis TaxID=340345 RepID=A0AAC9HL27_9PSEU|nr:protein kinase [Actinoalloteichus hymeniacidonis]AOS60875.1 protein kinase family protein [Actinoalloteichus hymeniacidonis]MBB5911125.1 serine/threonine-protein kinase [Actinoalloteichus hymeniacidonis]